VYSGGGKKRRKEFYLREWSALIRRNLKVTKKSQGKKTCKKKVGGRGREERDVRNRKDNWGRKAVVEKLPGH